MTPDETARLNARIDQQHEALTAFRESFGAALGRLDETSAEAIRARTDLDRLSRTIDGPPLSDALGHRVSTLEAQRTMEPTKRRAGGLDIDLPDPETIGAYGVNFAKWGLRAVFAFLVLTLAVMLYRGTLLDHFIRIYEITHPPVQVQVDVTPTVPADSSTQTDSLP